MYSKIALKNIKKSYKDYTIYFLTLMLAVCIFYSFNSIESQKVLIELKFMSDIMKAISGVSVLVSIILGGLIVYANNFLIKRRKKELGIYMILGMGKRKISRILVTETFIVGVISLVGGLVLGIGASQGLSTFTLNLFDVGMDEYEFIVSTSAIGKTILYFGTMFLLIMIFNVFVISKYKVIDLLIANIKNEDIKFKNPFIYLLTFVLCVISIGFSYKSLLEIPFDLERNMSIPIALAIVGTVLFFFSLAGVILYVTNKNKKIYFKGLNMFVLKQMNSKVNTNFISMSLICLMLFITIVVLSTGINFKKVQEEGRRTITPFDASVTLYNKDENKNQKNHIEDMLNKIDFKKSKNEKYAIYNDYYTGLKASELLKIKERNFERYNVYFSKISDYNKILKLKGEKEITLNKNEVLILSSSGGAINLINEKLKSNRIINIKGIEYLVKNDKVIEENLKTSSMADNFCTVVINDELVSDYKISSSILNVMYLDKNREENNKKYNKINDNYIKDEYKNLDIPIDAITKDRVYSKSNGITSMMLFISIYLGIVFLITSMAVLALQQLSEASDSIERYKALKRIGANKKMIDKTIFIQTLMYFSLPVILALIHSMVVIKIVNDLTSTIINTANFRYSILITVLIFVIVYLEYFYITYAGYKNIVKRNI
ncbi:FtsX-like permease family protein [Clostridium botulinum]|uniref:ABC transporter, permease protein n=1 Tax=Clostridium botulinum (strain Langeland / NCTC 10281 / Type F) TaxID=441772 RepID=A7GF77_CLOBL|nr:ABC transporter permease [Clostridium botulinum]ABS42270.1 ABC transporter, permease protein [Clostridium botulinum F str. Langeland]ADF99840.1 ABC transporter, permease protein [Clostridium botulinum F str. 230613]KKM42586.1 ABC transporter [Clostridium botulinum]MBY6794137.1 ABC transporter permease [Clostridium botulinum]MBY6937136.1 ABC transporter permease [Clostridium botulinum]